MSGFHESERNFAGDVAVDGSLITDRTMSGSQSPTITVFEDDSGQARAVGDSSEWTGADVIDAAQQAVDARLSETEGYFHLHVKGGIYRPSNTISVTGADAKDADGIKITGDGPYSTMFFGGNLGDGTPGGPWFIEINPDAGSTASDRIFDVQLADFGIDNRDNPGPTAGGSGTSDKDLDGIYVNDSRAVNVRRVAIQGCQQAFQLRNIWQAWIGYFFTRTCGDSANSISPIRIQTGETDFGNSGTGNAVNHIQFFHLQGNAGNDGPYVKIRSPSTGDGSGGTITPIIDSVGFTAPNVECSDQTFLDIDASRARVAVIGPQCQDPSPLVNATSAKAVTIDGGSLDNGSQLIYSQAKKTTVNGTTMTSGSGSADLIYIDGGQAAISNVNLFGCKRAVNVRGANAAISNVHCASTEEAAISLYNCSRAMVNGVTAKNCCVTDNESESPINFEACGQVSIDNVIASVDSSASTRAAVKDQFNTTNAFVGNVVYYGNATSRLNQHPDTKYVDNSGTATVSSGSTFVNVSHNLSDTPPSENIQVTPLGDLGSANYWYVTNVDATSFDINVDADPTKDVQFSWTAEL